MYSYCGKLCYVGEGRIGTIVSYEYQEESGATPVKTWGYRPLRSKKVFYTDTKPTPIDSVKFSIVDNAMFVAVKIKGQTYCGWSVKSPNDIADPSFGKRLAVARAIGDADAIANLIDDDFDADYQEEYGEGEMTPAKEDGGEAPSVADVPTINEGETTPVAE